MADDTDEDEDLPSYRVVYVVPRAAGLRVDRFLAMRFHDRSRTEFNKALKARMVTKSDGSALRPSAILRAGDVLHVHIEGIAPPGPPPRCPPAIYEDARVIALAKPAGMMAHPAGTRFVYAAVGLARANWPNDAVDLCHRLDKDTSGILLLTKDMAANALLKTAFLRGNCHKEYVAIVKGVPEWDFLSIEAPIGRAGGEIRIQMGVQPDGLPARTDVTVIGRKPEAGLSMVRLRLFTGRTHQIRVHLHHVGLPLLGDLMYGVPPEIFLEAQERGVQPEHVAVTGAPRQALHAAKLVFPHPDGRVVTVEAPLPDDMQAWWDDPASLPWVRATCA